MSKSRRPKPTIGDALYARRELLTNHPVTLRKTSTVPLTEVFTPDEWKLLEAQNELVNHPLHEPLQYGMDGRMTMVARVSPNETNLLKHIAQTVNVVFEESELVVKHPDSDSGSNHSRNK